MDYTEQDYLKRTLVLFILLSLITIPVFSQFVDSFSFMEDSKSYYEFIRAIKNNETQSLCLELYEDLDFSSYNLLEKSIFEVKAKINYSRYLIDNNQKNSALIILKEIEVSLKTLKPHEMFYDLLEAESKSLWYLINHFKYLAKAINATNLTKKNYNSYSNELSAVLQYANLLLYTPGKNPEEALNIFKLIKNEKLLEWDKFSLYSGLGISNFKLQNTKEALLYLSQAKSIYSGDTIINSALLKLT